VPIHSRSARSSQPRICPSVSSCAGRTAFIDCAFARKRSGHEPRGGMRLDTRRVPQNTEGDRDAPQPPRQGRARTGMIVCALHCQIRLGSNRRRFHLGFDGRVCTQLPEKMCFYAVYQMRRSGLLERPGVRQKQSGVLSIHASDPHAPWFSGRSGRSRKHSAARR